MENETAAKLKKGKRDSKARQTERPDLSILRKELPPYLSRKDSRFKNFTGYSPRSFANMDSRKETNTIIKIMLGGAVAYERESLVDWLEARSYVL